jgi:hypothetical protein
MGIMGETGKGVGDKCCRDLVRSTDGEGEREGSVLGLALSLALVGDTLSSSVEAEDDNKAAVGAAVDSAGCTRTMLLSSLDNNDDVDDGTVLGEIMLFSSLVSILLLLPPLLPRMLPSSTVLLEGLGEMSSGALASPRPP